MARFCAEGLFVAEGDDGTEAGGFLGMEFDIYTIPGSYSRNGSYHQFDLDSSGLDAMARALRDAVLARKNLRIEIGTGTLTVENVREAGLASYSDGIIHWLSNYADMIRLAETLGNIASASNSEIDEGDHVHLEPVYLEASNTVSDVVFQKQYEPKVTFAQT